MTKIITIIGFLEKNSGKTFIAKNLANVLTQEYLITPFKPLSGSNYWTHAEHTKYLIKKKKLFSKDLKEIIEAINYNERFPLNILNPIHSLFAPYGIDYILKENLSLNQFSQFNYWNIDQPWLIRYTIIDKISKKEKDIFLKNSNIKLDNGLELLTDSEMVIDFNTLDELSNLDKKYSYEALLSSFTHILDGLTTNSKRNVIIIEGFNDIVPLNDLIKKTDIIIMSSPGKIALFNIGKFIKTNNFLKENFLPTRKYLEYLKPEKLIDIPFHPSSQDWVNIKEKIINFSELNKLI